METSLNQAGWSDDQWNMAYRAINDEVSKVSVAGAFLPIYGPMQPTAEDVRHQNLELYKNPVNDSDPVLPLSVDDVDMLVFYTNTVYVSLKQQQMAQRELGDAILAFRRAANLIARAEDAIIFNGLPRDWQEHPRESLKNANVPDQCVVTRSRTGGSTGLYTYGRTPETIAAIPDPIFPDGEHLVTAIATAITTLEADGHLGPFACIMGTQAYVTAYTPNHNSLVLPSDRIQPMLGTTILRTGTQNPEAVIVVSLAGDPIDVVVATTPTVQFLNVNNEGRYLFRIYERFVLRVKEHNTVSSFEFAARPGEIKQNARVRA